MPTNPKRRAARYVCMDKQAMSPFWSFFSHHPSGAQVTDYSLAGALTTSPLWAPWLADVNGWLTFAGLLVGLALGVRRLWRDIQNPKD